MPKTYKPINDGLLYRSFAADKSTLDEDNRSINGIAATEQPVLMPDYDRMEMVPETLLMSGVRFADTVPLLNNHQRGDAEAVIGSATDLRNVDGRLMTRAVFSSTAEGIFTRVKEGHLKDLSVGYKVEKKRYIPKDKSERIAGREFTGPINVVTSWTVREVSVTPIGADDQAKLRGLSGDPFMKGASVMLTQEQRDKLVARGMPADLDDAAAVAWSIDNPEVRTVEKIVEKPVEARGADSADLFEKFKAEQKAEREAERKLHSFIREKCQRHGLDAQAVIDTCNTEVEAGRKILEMLEARQQDITPAIGRFEFGRGRNEKLGDVVRSAFLTRVLSSRGIRGESLKNLIGEKPQGADDFRNASLFDFAKLTLEAEGCDLRGLSKDVIAQRALGFNTESIRSGGYHFSASFPDLLLDAVNKTLLQAYTERPMTYSAVFRQAASVPDFKTIHRVRLSESPNPMIWPDNTSPEEIAFTDERESYAVEAYAEMASFSWRLLVNDDLDAISRIPQLMGRAAARKVNEVCWAVVTSNPTLAADGVALYSDATGARFNDNLTTGALTVGALGTAKSLMRRMKGANTKGAAAGPAILNIEPRFLVVPATIETTAAQLLNSAYDPADNKNQVYNPFRNLQLVVEPLLDDSSTQIWYLFADPGDIDTIEYTFLQGQETPVTDQWMDNETKSRKYSIVQTFAAKAIDHRGTVRSSGS